MRLDSSTYYSVAVSLLLSILSINCLAGEMNVKPGKWEFVSTTTMAMMGAPRTHTTTQCLKEAKVSPETLMKDMAQGCELLNSEASSNEMTWQVKCAQEGGEMTGSGQVRSNGNTVDGGMNMKMSFNGQTMDMDVVWNGKHIGQCDQ